MGGKGVKVAHVSLFSFCSTRGQSNDLRPARRSRKDGEKEFPLPLRHLSPRSRGTLVIESKQMKHSVHEKDVKFRLFRDPEALRLPFRDNRAEDEEAQVSLREEWLRRGEAQDIRCTVFSQVLGIQFRDAGRGRDRAIHDPRCTTARTPPGEIRVLSRMKRNLI